MKRRLWLLLCLVLSALLLTGCQEQNGIEVAGPEMSGFFSANRRDCRTGLAEVGGRVYGLSGYEGVLGLFTPAVERWSPDGERTRVGVNSALTSEINGIYALEDELLVWRLEKSLLTVLDHASPAEPRFERWNPQTSRSETLDGTGFAVQGRLWRNRDGQLQQLSADGSEVLATWPGTAVAWWDSFILLEDGDKDLVLEIATGECLDVTSLALPLESLEYSMTRYGHAVVEQGVMYLLEDTALTAIDLTDGTRRELLTFPEETWKAFVLDAERIIMLGWPRRGDPIQSAVYDRETMAQALSFTHMTNPTDVLLTGDTLYMYTPYSGAWSKTADAPGWHRNSSASIIDLRTGGEIWWELND